MCTCPNGHHGDALVNCYESQSVVASARYYRRYKRNGNFTESAVPENPAASEGPVAPAVPAVIAEEKQEQSTVQANVEKKE